MNRAVLQEKIRNIEKELELIKMSLQKEPDFEIDEKIWKEVRPIAKKIRAGLYKKYYGKK